MPLEIIERTRKDWITGNSNTCPHSVTCNCLTNGKQQPVIKQFRDHNLAGGGIPECCEEIRHILHPEKTDAELTAFYRQLSN